MRIKEIMLYGLAAVFFASCGNGPAAPAVSEPVKIEPGEQAPLDFAGKH